MQFVLGIARTYFKMQGWLSHVSPGARPVVHGMALVGHRGASAQRPENTLAALQKSWSDGAHGAEFDLQRLAIPLSGVR